MIYRIDVRAGSPAQNGSQSADTLGKSVRHQIAEFGMNVGPITTGQIYFIDTDADAKTIARLADELLADPVVEHAELIQHPPADAGRSRIEIHLKPGVMDPVAASTEMAIRDMGLPVKEVRTGRFYLIEGTVPPEELQRIASRVLANGVIESIHFTPFLPRQFPAGRDYQFTLKSIPIRSLSDEQLTKLSRAGHLFLSLAEMKAIQGYYIRQKREPTDIELETLAQTWSEHCVHKTLKSAVDLEIHDEAGRVLETRHYDNLIRDTIFKSTMELMEESDKAKSSGFRVQGSATPLKSSGNWQLATGNWQLATGNWQLPPDFCLSVFSDNAGVIAFDETDAVCFKVETHNHPSAIEPYGGSATGIGGVIRDILGTGLGAKPVANTDVFCVAFPNYGLNPEPRTLNPLPKGVIHPKRILRQVVAGVRDYGNRMGIPTINGAVYFDNRYLGNPLVFCGCVGLIPRNKIAKETQPGDAIVVMGGRTGRDGIHGATFSSAELTDTHADEFSHAVQIGNAITEKKVADVILAARDRGLFTAITDCGAGGLSSAIGEMGEKLGAFVELAKVPLKYAGLRYDEIWISEAQERMVLSVPTANVEKLLALARSEDVEATVIGQFGTEKSDLVLDYRSTEVGRLSMEFLHHGLPKSRRKAIAIRSTGVSPVHEQASHATARDRLLQLLAHPNIASKHWIIRQYDHEVLGGSVIKPLTGPRQMGPSDASVIRPKLNTYRGVAIGCGLSPQITDPYDMAIAAIDEAIRNVVAVGADPSRIAILDNFCWPSVDDEKTMGTLARACEACYDAAKAYGIPFISGKDSLHNQFTNQETGQVIRIPNTLLISAIAVLEDVRKCVTMDLKKPGNKIYLIQPRQNPGQSKLTSLAAVHRALAAEIRGGHVVSAHDISDGGALVAAAEMSIASGLGVELDFQECKAFDETPGQYLVEVPCSAKLDALKDQADIQVLGHIIDTPSLICGGGDIDDRFNVSIADLQKAWLGTLDW
jgi:phosphoribosylformylglycinamidine synthase